MATALYRVSEKKEKRKKKRKEKKEGKQREKKNSQISQTQNAHEVNAKFSSHSQRPNHKNGKRCKKHISRNVERGVHQSKRDKHAHRVALWFEGEIPVAGHGFAVEEKCHGSHDGVANDHNYTNR